MFECYVAIAAGMDAIYKSRAEEKLQNWLMESHRVRAEHAAEERAARYICKGCGAPKDGGACGYCKRQ